jgi:hypothetical protein
VLEDECLQGAIVGFPDLMTFRIGGDVGLIERSIKPVGKSMVISEK